MIKTLSILSISIVMLQGCSSMSTRSGDGPVNVFKLMSFQEPGTAPWDPPIEVGYGGRIPNMSGDWERHCSGVDSSVWRQAGLLYIKGSVLYRFYRELSLHQHHTSTRYINTINARLHQSTASLVSTMYQQRMSTAHIIRTRRRSHEQINESTYKIFVNLQVLHNYNTVWLFCNGAVEVWLFCNTFLHPGCFRCSFMFFVLFRKNRLTKLVNGHILYITVKQKERIQ